MDVKVLVDKYNAKAVETWPLSRLSEITEVTGWQTCLWSDKPTADELEVLVAIQKLRTIIEKQLPSLEHMSPPGWAADNDDDDLDRSLLEFQLLVVDYRAMKRHLRESFIGRVPSHTDPDRVVIALDGAGAVVIALLKTA